MKVFITGGNGLLGQKLISEGRKQVRIVASARSTPRNSTPDFHPLDVTDARQVESLLGRVRPEWVIHTAALTDVDRCESERDLAWSVNVEGTENLVRACASSGVGLVHLSTDYVFDGTSGPYAETDRANPLSYYGLTKLRSEELVLSSKGPAAVVRTIVLFGQAPGARPNFVTWLIRTLRRGQTVRIVTDQWGTPTFADDLAVFLLRICKECATGVYHYAGPDLMSRHQMAIRVCRRFGFDESLVVPITTPELCQAAPRPLRSGLKTDRMRARFHIRPVPYDEGLDRLSEQLGDLSALG